jgi:cytochrome oxidase Cu insertion factor (SCO1/SenC/PrrC family)/thiol-disulfide isomerase/thioredoxin
VQIGLVHPRSPGLSGSWRIPLSLLALVAALAAFLPASVARADGDPGSDVLVYQPLFLGSDAGVSITRQAQLGGLLRAAGRAGFPVRVAIIAKRDDLGAVTGLWRKPRPYARFLGLELSLAYKGRLLVVMPNGIGFSWPGHSPAAAYRTLRGIAIAGGGSGLATAAQTAVQSLATAGGVKLAAPATAAGAAPDRAASGNGTGARASGGASNDDVLVFLGIVAALGAGGLGLRYALKRRRSGSTQVAAQPPRSPVNARPRRRCSLRLGIPVAAVLVVAAGVPIVAFGVLGSPGTRRIDALERNPDLDPGTPLTGTAPDFRLSDQFGRQVSLSSFHGRVVILAFNDSECTTICPLTTSAMVQAKAMLGPAGRSVQLLAVDANPKATALEDVLSYSQVHGMLHQWHFLTGSTAALRRVWKAYSIGVQISQRQVDHSPAVFVIDSTGRLAKLYVTQQSYAAVGQFGQVLAKEVSGLLPGHPQVRSSLSYEQIAGTSPTAGVAVPRVGGGNVRLGPGRSPRLYLFFATWDQEVTSLGGQLQALNRYQSSAAASKLPSLTAVDEGSVEPSPGALSRFLGGLPHRLSYPVAVDRSGRVADGYEVQGQPWFVLTSPSGHILWYWQVSTSGWLTQRALTHHIRAALARVPKTPTGAGGRERELAGSPAPLASLHQQATRLLGSEQALAARVGALKGFPVVINAWASWCTPCRSEFGLFADASAHYGRNVAFLGADTNDSAGDAQSFLARHPVSYPSYQSNISDLHSLAVIEGLPTTVFINSAGKVVYVHTGQYDSQGTLDSDIQTYAK